MPALLGSGRDALTHQALMYGSETEFAETARMFLGEGRARGDALVVIASPERLALLADGPDGPGGLDGVACHDPAAWFETPPRSIAAATTAGRERWWRDGRRVRIVAEQSWTGRTPAQIREWKRFEALLNVVFAGTPTDLLCAYDLRTVPSDIMRIAERTHHGPDYEPPLEIYTELNRLPLMPRTGRVAGRGFVQGELPALRDFTAKATAGFGLRASMPLIMGVDEVATNIIKHGGGCGSLFVWSDGSAVICDLLDPVGRVDDRFLGFLPPSPDTPPGAGMWMVRQLCDLVEIRSGDAGSVFRLAAWLRDD